MQNKIVVGGVLVALVLSVIGIFYPKSQLVTQFVGGASPSGSTFNTQKQLGVVASLSAGTTTSVQNTTGADQYITGFYWACSGVGSSNTAYTGAGLANLTVKAATTTSSFNASTPTSNTAVNANLSLTTTNISTSTAFTAVGSTTIADATPSFMIVPAGSYLTFVTNATNTAACTFVAEVIGS